MLSDQDERWVPFNVKWEINIKMFKLTSNILNYLNLKCLKLFMENFIKKNIPADQTERPYLMLGMK